MRPFDNGDGGANIQGGGGGRNEIILDGSPSTYRETGTAADTISPPPDAVNEIKIQTNVYDAEFGRTAGGVITLSLKSGTNDYHGSAAWYARNDVFNANNFETNAAGGSKATFKMNQPTIMFSGPVRIPKLYNGRDRSFFMYALEIFRDSRPNTGQNNSYGVVPTERQRVGDFGTASVDSVDGSLQLGVDRGYSLIVTNQRIAGDEYTLRFDGRITWSAPGRIVVLYKDENNYYSVGLGEQPGIYRKLNGVEIQLHEDPESLVRLPHGPAETGAFKVYAHNTGQSIVVKADKAGDGVDYDIEILDSDPTAVATFTQTGIGMLSTGGEPWSPWFYIDNVAIYDELVQDTYDPVNYYVDQNHPQASDDNPGTESLPWLTIQKAADSVLAGDTVIVKAGTYKERITFANGRRGAPGQVITFKAQPRRSVTGGVKPPPSIEFGIWVGSSGAEGNLRAFSFVDKVTSPPPR